MVYFPEEVLEQIIDYVESNCDRNSVSSVNKLWYKVDRYSRRNVYVGNCYAITPERVINRFPKLRSLSLKGNISTNTTGLGFGYPWILALSKQCPSLQGLRFKRMVVSDEALVLISSHFPSFKSLHLISCCGFTTVGLSAIATHCRFLEQLDLQSSEVEDHRGQWLSCFPRSCTSLTSLNFVCLAGAVNLGDLERLVARCRNLTTLRLNRAVPMTVLHRILSKAPQLQDFGVGSFTTHVEQQHTYSALCKAFRKLKSLQNLSVFFQVTPNCLYAIKPICGTLLCLNLRHATVRSAELIGLIKNCHKLQRLGIPPVIGDKDLGVVASSCKDLRELRIFHSSSVANLNEGLTEGGLLAIAMGCPLLSSLMYFCKRMTNAALTTLAKNCPNIACFRLCTYAPKERDHVTLQPLDDGFGTIVQLCKGLKRLSISGFVTDQVFLYIGMYAEQLEVLSVAHAGESDQGILYVSNGCGNIKELEIKDCRFGDSAVLADVMKCENMHSLWITSSSRKFTFKTIKTMMPPFWNLEIMNEKDQTEVKKLYFYRTLA